MVNARTVAAVFAVLFVLSAATTGYLFLNPSTKTNTVTVTSTTTTVSAITATATVTSSAPASTVQLAHKAGIGFYLENATGWTLYFRTSDGGNGSNSCTGGCITAWPAFYASTLNLPPGFDQGDFKLVQRADGIKQLAYYGWPLYYFAGDKKPGDVTGEGIAKVWYACCSVVNATG
jgi:predicted lipoprotein with Yx(FWY)xxD motif